MDMGKGACAAPVGALPTDMDATRGEDAKGACAATVLKTSASQRL
jgi:hypothetical protein